MIEDLHTKPLHVQEQIENKMLVTSGARKSECFYCKRGPCFELSFQGPYAVETFLYDEKRMVCKRCFNFMQSTGKYVTKAIRLLLKLDVLLRRVYDARRT